MLVFDGFSKAYGMTGWRLGFAHGPRRLIEEMTKLQQFTFVCAPSMVQHAGVAALDYDVSGFVADYHQKRDRIYDGIKDHYEMTQAGRSVLPVPEGAARHGHGVRRRGDPQQLLVHSRRRVQPPRHALPPELRRRRAHPGPGHRNPQSAGPQVIACCLKCERGSYNPSLAPRANVPPAYSAVIAAASAASTSLSTSSSSMIASIALALSRTSAS